MWLLVALSCRSLPSPPPASTDDAAPTEEETAQTGDSGAVDPCGADPEVVVESVTVTQPWTPHEAELAVSLAAPAAIAARCTSADAPEEQHLVERGATRDEHVLRIAGLLGGTQYTCDVAAVCPTSAAPVGTVSFTTPPRNDASLPGMMVERHLPEAGREYVVTDLDRYPYDGSRPLVFDRDGQLRWSPEVPHAAAVAYLPDLNAFAVTGTWPPAPDKRTRFVDLFGGTVLYDVHTDLPDGTESLFHHDGRRLADGRLVTLEERSHQNANKRTVRSFAARIVDPATGTVDFDYDSERGYLEGHLLGRSGNSYHPNWVNVYPIDGTEVLHVSLCGPSQTVAIDVPTGDWRWSFGAGGDFALVDADGTPLPDDDFPQCQHGLQRDGDRLLVYDNGRERGESRAVEFRLDETTMTATRVWSWTEPGWHENNFGGVDWTAAGNVFIAMGHGEVLSPSPGDVTTFVEVDPSTDAKVWEARYTDVQDQAFRAELADPCELFTNARYCDALADRLEVLAPLFP